MLFLLFFMIFPTSKGMRSIDFLIFFSLAYPQIQTSLKLKSYLSQYRNRQEDVNNENSTFVKRFFNRHIRSSFVRDKNCFNKLYEPFILFYFQRMKINFGSIFN